MCWSTQLLRLRITTVTLISPLASSDSESSDLLELLLDEELLELERSETEEDEETFLPFRLDCFFFFAFALSFFLFFTLFEPLLSRDLLVIACISSLEKLVHHMVFGILLTLLVPD